MRQPMIIPTINYLAVFVAAVASIVIGSFWYSPVLFGKIWMRESKISMPKKVDKAEMSKTYIIALGTSLVTAYILAHFVDYVEVTTMSTALVLAFWIWLGFYVTTEMGAVLWEKKSWTMYLVKVGYHLVNLGVMATILALWV